MSSTGEGGGAVGAVSTEQTIINNNNYNDSARIDIDVSLSNGELENLESLVKAFKGGQPNLTANPLIRKVPSTLRRNKDFKKYFWPKVISIGPLHHDHRTLQESKELKLKLAAHFVKKVGVDGESLYSNIKKEMDGLRKCYDPQELEKYSDDDEKLAWMFFVDGCAILQAVYMRYGDDICKIFGQFIKNDLLTFVYSDLLLLENQIPFRVLELLTSSSDGEKFMNAIIRFMDDTAITPAEDSEWWPQQEGKQIHLLHLLRVRLLFKKEKPRGWGIHKRLLLRLEKLRRWCFPFCIEHEDRKEERTKRCHSHTIHNVKELKKLGISLKASETSCLTDISFNRILFVGKLCLPPISVDDSTMNLIAYEMCPDFHNDFSVTSYMCFLGLLIDEAEDVKELRDAGILYNRLGSDKEVAKLFNKMNTGLVPSPMIYSGVKRKIHDHHNNRWIKYPTQVYRTFFRTRWTFFAFVGAIAALFIGALQTYYTIHQPKFCSGERWWEQKQGERIHLLHLLRVRLGISLKASETSCLTDISFNRILFVGKLCLPPISVNDSTMNLIAYEMCPDFDNDFTVTSYMCFLDLLIDEAEDVKDLRDAGIPYNGLGSDEEVAKFFNNMNTENT